MPQERGQSPVAAVQAPQSKELQVIPATSVIPKDSRPPRMLLKFKRSQRTSVMGKVIFVVDARMDVPPEERELIRKYRLGDDVIYESANRQQRKEATAAHLDRTRMTTGFRDSGDAQLKDAGRSFYRLVRAGISATAAALSLKITINSLIAGVHIECKDMGELLEAEDAVREAGENLRAYLDIAETFDGREVVVEL